MTTVQEGNVIDGKSSNLKNWKEVAPRSTTPAHYLFIITSRKTRRSHFREVVKKCLPGHAFRSALLSTFSHKWRENFELTEKF